MFFEHRGSKGSVEDKETPAACVAAIKASQLAKAVASTALFEDEGLRLDLDIGGLVKVEV